MAEFSAEGVCRAVIDIGSNSVKLLVGRVTGSTVIPLLERAHQTRLGAGSFHQKVLSEDAIARTVVAARLLCDEAHRYSPVSIRAIATAATREARNGEQLVDAFQKACGFEVEVISGETEAAMAFRGVSSDPRFDRMALLVTDVGGGSTEFVLGHSGQRHYSQSFAAGVVRLHESSQIPECPNPADLQRCRTTFSTFLEEHVRPALQHGASRLPYRQPPTLVAVGGTAVVLARIVHALDAFDREHIERTELTRETLSHWTERLWSMTLPERRTVAGLPPERADIILAGAVIYEAILTTLNFPGLRASTRGLRFAALLESK
jgi:exopolyphosphatase/guanosine-5'-triphosphate,3'-diphosphate pyrophosphatase